MRRQAGKYRIILKKRDVPRKLQDIPYIYIQIQSRHNMQYHPPSTARSSFRYTSFPSHFRAYDVSHIDSRIDTRISNLLPRKRIFSSKLVYRHIPPSYYIQLLASSNLRCDWSANYKSFARYHFLFHVTAQRSVSQFLSHQLNFRASFVFDWTRWNNAGQSCRDECQVSTIKFQVEQEIFFLDIGYRTSC